MKGINPKLKLYCPTWYGRIRHTKDEDKQDLLYWTSRSDTNLRSGSCCVVGELHGWTTDYVDKHGSHCEGCYYFARSIYGFAWYKHDSDGFKTIVNLLVNHIEQNHPEIVERVSAK